MTTGAFFAEFLPFNFEEFLTEEFQIKKFDWLIL